MWTATKFQCLAIGWLAVVMVMMPSLASAQHDEPLQLVYVNISGADGISSHQTVDELFEESDQIDSFDGEEFLAYAEDYGIDATDLTSEHRGDVEDELAALMWERDIEGLMVHHVEDGEDRLYIGVIGPRGWELGEVEVDLDQGSLERDRALVALEQIFNPLVPEVRGFRRDVDQGAVSDEDFELPDRVDEQHEVEEDETTEEDETRSLREMAMEEHRRRYGNLERNISLRAGPSFGHRSLRMSTESDGFDLRHSAPLMGFAVRVDGLIMTFDRETAALEAGGTLGFSSLTTAYGGTELDGQFLNLSGEVRYINARAELLRFRGIAGIETLNLTLDENEDYTGHGYLYGRVGGGVEYGIGDLVTLQLDVLAMPVISATNSGDAYGEVSGWLGAGAEMTTYVRLAEPVLISVDYGIRYFDVEYPDADQLADIAQSHDLIHQVMIGVGYRL